MPEYVKLDRATIRSIGAEMKAAMTEALALDRALIREVTEPAPAEVPGAHLEPWTFYSPRRSANVAAYVDDQNQVRHVGLDVEAHVPVTWRKVYVTAPNRQG